MVEVSLTGFVRRGHDTMQAMRKFMIAYIAAFIAMLLLDGVWLGLVALPVYKQGIGHLMASAPLVPVALVFYIGYPLGLAHFAVLPSFSAAHAARQGALFGLFAYGTYDLTNWATLRGWSVQLSLVDGVWGMCVSSAGMLTAWWAVQRFGNHV